MGWGPGQGQSVCISMVPLPALSDGRRARRPHSQTLIRTLPAPSSMGRRPWQPEPRYSAPRTLGQGEGELCSRSRKPKLACFSAIFTGARIFSLYILHFIYSILTRIFVKEKSSKKLFTHTVWWRGPLLQKFPRFLEKQTVGW